MKQVKILLIALAAVISFTNCKKSDDDNKTAKEFKGEIISVERSSTSQQYVYMLAIEQPANIGTDITIDGVNCKNVVKTYRNSELCTGKAIGGTLRLSDNPTKNESNINQQMIKEVIIETIFDEYKNPLANTKWKLELFVDLENKIEKKPEPDKTYRYNDTLIFNSYSLKFTNDAKIVGFSSNNLIHGQYNINTKENLIDIYVGLCTFVCELPDGSLFMDILNNNIDSYAYNDKVLLLYANSNKSKYLQFKKLYDVE